MPFHKPRTMFAPTSVTCEMPSDSALTMPVMISGIARTISAMICGRFVIRDVSSFTPVSTISGILSVKAFTIAEMISGSASTMVKMISGRLSISAVSSLKPASMISGKCVKSV